MLRKPKSATELNFYDYKQWILLSVLYTLDGTANDNPISKSALKLASGYLMLTQANRKNRWYFSFERNDWSVDSDV